ncbi:MAG: COX15/CtaA family protein [Acidobacteriia bacterium]|nr:COX15/CtaA family protein [Terriglobia bacterium]
MGNVWLRRYSVLVAVCTLLLVIAGGLVTSNDAALSIPDWPLSLGRLVPPLEGGIRFEFAHRLLAAAVAVLTFILAFWLQTAEPRLWLRRLGWVAVGTVLAQALLGGAAVKFVDPKPVSIAHACLAQLCFGIIVAVAVASRTDDRFSSSVARQTTPTCGEPADSKLTDHKNRSSVPLKPLIAAAALLVQTALGAAVRHSVASVIPHIAGAAVSTLLVMWAGLQVLTRHMENTLFRRSATLLLSLTFSQVFLGMGAYMSRILTADAPQPMPVMIWFTVAHVAAGSLAFGAAVALALIVYRDARPAPAALEHGGMAVA